MKRSFMIILLITLCFAFLSCVNNTTDIQTSETTSAEISTTISSNSSTTQSTDITTVTTINTTDLTTDLYDLTESYDVSSVYTSYATNVVYEAYRYNSDLSLPQVYIDINFTSINYKPVFNTLSMEFQVYDPDPQNAIYFAILQDRYSLEIISEQSFYGSGFEFTAAITFDISEIDISYNVLIGKYDGDNPDLTIGYLKPSLIFSWDDADIQSRSSIEIDSLSDASLEFIDSLIFSTAEFELIVDDPEEAISSITALLYNENEILVNSFTTDTGSIRSGNSIILEGAFTDIVPNTDYTLIIKISGYDNQDSFTDEQISKSNLHSAQLLSRENKNQIAALDGLYAVVYDVSYTEEAMIISYYYENEEYYTNDLNGEVLQLHLLYGSHNISENLKYDLIPGYNEIEIPLESVEENNYIFIVDSNEEILFEYIYFPSLRPNVTVYSQDIFNYNITVTGIDDNLVNVDIEIYVEGFPTCIESFRGFDPYEEISITLYHDFSNIENSIEMRIIVTYFSYGKIMTYIETKRLY